MGQNPANEATVGGSTHTPQGELPPVAIAAPSGEDPVPVVPVIGPHNQYMRDFVSTVNSLLQHQDNHQVGLIAAMSHFTRKLEVAIAAITSDMTNVPNNDAPGVHENHTRTGNDLINFMAAKVAQSRQELSTPVQAPMLTTPGKLAFLTQREEQLIDEIAQFIKGTSPVFTLHTFYSPFQTGKLEICISAAALLIDMEVDEDAVAYADSCFPV
ncbi:hypothetical protein CEUSTIGMA_g6959.t1 [Chlamydomonas eustigma]|uniref:Uncharacterized protein n=1 Tax=Chlamydomonas eustigma TaxID=1157962 RepID=A0A250X8W5_9CHLO|nr:hypothetical protein CEUSTIGMA_g6959.t1 [Chlamydomonas eustigma]|eukprot:GAX79518.1 hypothetical protein CEUSTIGMA_g6959.t1 [Chlamydomonas eustigma]